MGHFDTVPYVGNETFQAVELPYSGKSLSMVAFLPRKTDGLDQLEGWLSPVFLSRWLRQMKNQEVALYLPRFKLGSSFELTGDLAKMGMVDAFSPEFADFSGIDGTRNLVISSVLHKAWVDVTEEGTEAAAATATGVAVSGVDPNPQPPPPVFRADHPFVFLILEKHSGSILFLGRVNDPSK
jgi:serpin B